MLDGRMRGELKYSIDGLTLLANRKRSGTSAQATATRIMSQRMIAGDATFPGTAESARRAKRGWARVVIT
jgi:hypothetical protein